MDAGQDVIVTMLKYVIVVSFIYELVGIFQICCFSELLKFLLFEFFQ